MELKPGDRVRWRSINSEPTGVVVSIGPAGALVRVDGSDKYVILTISDNTISNN